MKCLYANGDSFVAGMECLGDNDRSYENRYLAFPKIVGSNLGYTEYINNAVNGATNEYITRKTVIDLLSLESKGVDPSDVFVIIGWTSLFRLQIDRASWVETIPAPKGYLGTDDDKEPFFINPNSGHLVDYNGKRYTTEDTINPFCTKYLWHHYLQNPQLEIKIILLEQFLKSKGYNYLFVNTCGFFDLEIANATQHFYKNLKESFYSWALKNYPERKRQFNHFDHIVHEEYAKLLVKYIIESNLQKNI